MSEPVRWHDGALTSGSFHAFFNQIDQFKSNHFLWLTAGGLSAADMSNCSGSKVQENVAKQLGDEDEDPEGGEG